MKRPITSALLAAALSLSLVVPAGAVSSSTAVEAIQALGIITGDSSGNLNLSSPVTRAEFVTMMTAASSYKDSIGEGSGVSLFKDVKSDHWASEYIKLAVEQGWMSGYVDGTFRPDDQITLEEACTALLKMLGYDSSTLAGSYPSAQLSKASSVGLRDDLDAVQGEALTRQDCVMLFYNLLVSDDSSGTVYGTTLGYTVTNGEVDYSTLVTADTKGPYVASADKSLSLPFSSTGATIYRNGALSSLSAVQEYDVYYYNANMRQLVVDKLSGAEMVVFNRMQMGADVMPFHKLARAVNRRIDIVYDYVDGSTQFDEIEDPLPFDINAPVIEVKDEDYALFYRDITEEPKKYDKKTVCFKAQVAKLRREKVGMFAPGRFVMTCCEADITFMGIPCKWAGAEKLAARSWVMVEAKVSVQYHNLYRGVGPILTAASVTPAEPAAVEVTTF